MVGGEPHTLLAPHITLQSWSHLEVLGCTVVSFVVCSISYYGGRFYSPLLFQCYPTLSNKDRREWDVRYSSMVHSFLCVWYAYIMLWDSDFFFRDGAVPHMLRTHNITYTELGISLGYFVVDFFVCLKWGMGGFAMVAHHVGTLTAIIAAIWGGQCHMLSVWILLTEFTTPFINVRWCLEKAGMKNSQLYIINGLAIFLGWIAARIVIFLPFFYTVYLQRDEIPLLNPISKFILYVFPAALTVLNLWWFSKICKGVVKVLFGGPKVKVA